MTAGGDVESPDDDEVPLGEELPPLVDVESLDDDEELPEAAEDEVAAEVDEVDATVVVVVPIDPSKTITPQNRAKAESVAATTVRLIRRMRAARSASRARPSAARSDGWVVGMRPS